MSDVKFNLKSARNQVGRGTFVDEQLLAAAAEIQQKDTALKRIQEIALEYVGEDGPYALLDIIVEEALDCTPVSDRPTPNKPKCSNCGDFSYDCKVCGGKPNPDADNQDLCVKADCCQFSAVDSQADKIIEAAQRVCHLQFHEGISDLNTIAAINDLHKLLPAATRQ